MSGLVVETVTRADWPTLCAGFADLGFEQSRSYGEAAARRIGGTVQYCVLSAQGHPVAAAAVRIKRIPGLGRGIAWIAAGPLVRPGTSSAPDAAELTDIFTALRKEFCDRHGHVLRLRLSGTSFVASKTVSDAARNADLLPTGRAPVYMSAILPVEHDSETLMARLHGKWRTDLRFAQKSAMTLDIGSDLHIVSRFMALYERVQQAKGFHPDIPPGFHFPLSDETYRVEILIAVKNGVDVAGIVTGTCGATATYLFGATSDSGRPLKAGYLLQWEAMARARLAGCHWYDLGGIDPVTNPDVARFKERMGGLPVLTEPWEARPAGLAGRVVPALEALRARLKRRR